MAALGEGFSGDGGIDLAAATPEDLYTCPGNKTAKLDIWFTERAGAVATIKLSVRREAAGAAAKQYLLYDYPLKANGYKRVFELDVMSEDVVTVEASTGDVSVNVFVKEMRTLA